MEPKEKLETIQEGNLTNSQIELQSKTSSLQLVNSIAEILHSSLDFTEVVQSAQDTIIKYLQIPAVTIYSYEEEKQILKRIAFQGFQTIKSDKLNEGEIITLDSGLTGYAVKHNEVVICHDLESDERISSDLKQVLLSLGLTASVTLPLRYQDQVLGAISLLFKESIEKFAYDLETLVSIARTLGLAMANAQYVDRIEAEVAARTKAEADLKEHRDHLEELVKERTADLIASNEELESFSYSVSHDLRTPLRALDGYSMVILEDYGDHLDDQGQEYLERIRAASQRMGQIIDDILSLSRINRSEMHIQTVNLSVLVASIFVAHQMMEPERQVEFVLQKDIAATGDARLLTIALENLLGNAWKFTAQQPKARIEFGTKQQDKESAFFIRDNGIGFEMQYADKLFAPFQRLHTEDDFPGMGIGLSTVKRIIRRHNGKIWAEGEIGKGATFYFTLNTETE